jgi:hypothetical protein
MASSFAVMPKSIATQLAVKILVVEQPVRRCPFVIFTLKNRTVSPVVDRFIAHPRDFARQMPANKLTSAPFNSRSVTVA